MTMQSNGNTLHRHDVAVARQLEKMRAESAFGRMREHMEKSQAALTSGDPWQYWHWRGQAMADQVEGDRAAYAEVILAQLLEPPAVPTYKPDVIEGYVNPDGSGEGNWHEGHDHVPADGADGRDAHAS